MLRIGKLTDYATVILANLATDRARLHTAAALSEKTHIAAPTVAKLLKQLHRALSQEMNRETDHIAAWDESEAPRSSAAPTRRLRVRTGAPDSRRSRIAATLEAAPSSART